jgi:hypothetical protein
MLLIHFRTFIANCKAFLSLLSFGLFASLILASGQSVAHEIRPAVADLSIMSTTTQDQALGRLVIIIDFNVEMFLADLDASVLKNTDNAQQGEDYDAYRRLSMADLSSQFSEQWPRFAASLVGRAGREALAFQLGGIEVENNVDLSLPRSSKVSIYSYLPDNNSPIEFGWDTKLGPLVLRQQDLTANPDDLYTAYLPPGSISAPIPRQGHAAQSTKAIITDYIKNGFIHIVPKGFDHILFVLGLFFYAARWQPLLGQVTLFTLAHSLTLFLASTGYIVVSPTVIEPMIAASIIYIAYENIWRQRMNAIRILVIFLFGLLHGLGFASVLSDIMIDDSMPSAGGFANGKFILSLISFNIGVELGQLAVLAPAFLLFGVIANNALWYRKLIALPASCLIGAIGAWMLFTRVIID